MNLLKNKILHIVQNDTTVKELMKHHTSMSHQVPSCARFQPALVLIYT
jgi:hypothetical protein